MWIFWVLLPGLEFCNGVYKFKCAGGLSPFFEYGRYVDHISAVGALVCGPITDPLWASSKLDFRRLGIYPEQLSSAQCLFTQVCTYIQILYIDTYK